MVNAQELKVDTMGALTGVLLWVNQGVDRHYLWGASNGIWVNNGDRSTSGVAPAEGSAEGSADSHCLGRAHSDLEQLPWRLRLRHRLLESGGRLVIHCRSILPLRLHQVMRCIEVTKV